MENRAQSFAKMKLSKPELESEIDGDINVQYIIIYALKDDEVYREEEAFHKDYKEEQLNQEMSVGVFFYSGNFQTIPNY